MSKKNPAAEPSKSASSSEEPRPPRKEEARAPVTSSVAVKGNKLNELLGTSSLNEVGAILRKQQQFSKNLSALRSANSGLIANASRLRVNSVSELASQFVDTRQSEQRLENEITNLRNDISEQTMELHKLRESSADKNEKISKLENDWVQFFQNDVNVRQGSPIFRSP